MLLAPTVTEHVVVLELPPYALAGFPLSGTSENVMEFSLGL